MESLDYAKFLVAFLCWGVLAFLLLCFIVCAVLDWKESGRARREAAALRELLGVANEFGGLPDVIDQTTPDGTYSDGKGDG